MGGTTPLIEGAAAAALRTHRPGSHCGSSALRDLLEHHELDLGAGPLTEGETFVLAGGLSMLFTEATRDGLGMYLLGRSHTLEADLCANLGVACEQRSTDDPELAWAWVEREVEAGRPLMVWADIQHLDYLDGRMHNSNHDVIAVGYDPDAGEVLLADHALPGIQRCGLESFEAARASDGFPGPHGRRTWFMQWPDELPAADEAVARAIRGAAGRLLRGEDDVPYTTGLAALRELDAAIAGWHELDDRTLRERLHRLWFCIDKAGTGGGFFRALWSGGLRSLSSLLDDPELARLADLYADLADEWSSLARGGMGRERREALRAATARVAQIARLEEEGARGLTAWSGPQPNDTRATRGTP